MSVYNGRLIVKAIYDVPRVTLCTFGQHLQTFLFDWGAMLGANRPAGLGALREIIAVKYGKIYATFKSTIDIELMYLFVFDLTTNGIFYIPMRSNRVLVENEKIIEVQDHGFSAWDALDGGLRHINGFNEASNADKMFLLLVDRFEAWQDKILAISSESMRIIDFKVSGFSPPYELHNMSSYMNMDSQMHNIVVYCDNMYYFTNAGGISCFDLHRKTNSAKIKDIFDTKVYQFVSLLCNKGILYVWTYKINTSNSRGLNSDYSVLWEISISTWSVQSYEFPSLNLVSKPSSISFYGEYMRFYHIADVLVEQIVELNLITKETRVLHLIPLVQNSVSIVEGGFLYTFGTEADGRRLISRTATPSAPQIIKDLKPQPESRTNDPMNHSETHIDILYEGFRDNYNPSMNLRTFQYYDRIVRAVRNAPQLIDYLHRCAAYVIGREHLDIVSGHIKEIHDSYDLLKISMLAANPNVFERGGPDAASVIQQFV